MKLDSGDALRLKNIPRISLAFLPTPLKEATRLAEA